MKYLSALNLQLALIGLLISLACSSAQVAEEKPACHLQILTGIQPNPVDFLLDDKLVFPDATAGQRITGIPLPKATGNLVVRDKVFGKEFIIPFDLKPGSKNTLIIAGEFKAKTEDSTDTPEPLVHLLQENSKPTDAKNIRLSVLNGSSSVPVPLANGNRALGIVQPLNSAVFNNLPADLLITAFIEKSPRKLYLAQENEIFNLALVFFPSDGGVAFKAMMCQFPE